MGVRKQNTFGDVASEIWKRTLRKLLAFFLPPMIKRESREMNCLVFRQNLQRTIKQPGLGGVDMLNLFLIPSLTANTSQIKKHLQGVPG